MTLSVLIITYNQEKYIAQAIKSALIQKTDFDYEIVIGEDCSTDKTRKIVLEYKAKYPDKIKLLLQEKNVGMIPNFIDTLKACSGKYIALLEGDDYWIDPYKLQKQVDIMEANPDIGLVHTNYDRLYQVKNKIQHSVYKKNYKAQLSGYIFESLLLYSYIVTATVLLRTDILKEAINSLRNKLLVWPAGDYPLWLYISSEKKVGYIDEATAVYRHGQNTMSKPLDFAKALKLHTETEAMKKFFIGNYYVSEKTKKIFFYRMRKRDIKFGLLHSVCHMSRKAIHEILNDFPFKNFYKFFMYTLLYLFSMNKISWSFLSYLYRLKNKLRIYNYPDATFKITN